MTAVVIPVKPGDDNPELRYALRSIATHVPNPDVWVVGWRPDWLHDVHWVLTKPRGSKSDRGCQQTRAAIETGDVPDGFWWWDDDMVALTEPDPGDVLHGGPVRDWLARFADKDTQYTRALRRTVTLKLRAGLRALMYDLHTPMWCRKRELADVMRALPDGRGGWLWRTVYGNHLGLGGRFVRDVKVYADQPVPDAFGAWLSWDDASLPRLQPMLDELFPDPSPWEGEPKAHGTLLATYTRGGVVRRVPYRASQERLFRLAGWRRESVQEEVDHAGSNPAPAAAQPVRAAGATVPDGHPQAGGEREGEGDADVPAGPAVAAST